MAITIKTDLPEYSPVYNQMMVCITSTNTAQPNFKYIFDIVTETHGTIRTKVIPEPTLGYGFQDVGQILEGFIKESIAQYNSTASFVFGLTEPILKFHIEYGEEYGATGSVVEYPNETTGTDKYAWCASFGYHDWVNQINLGSPFNTWTMNLANGVNGEFLTNYKTPSVTITDLGWHWLMTDEPANIDYVEIKTYDSAGALISTFQNSRVTSTSATASRLLSLATSPQSLNNIVGGFLLGAQPIITSSVASYTIQVFEGAAQVMSEILTFTIGDCSRYGTTRIHFLNELGGFDSYNFTLRSLPSSSATRKSYTREKTNVQTAGLVFKHEENGTVDYYVKSRDKIKLESDYLTEEQNTWLKELIESPQVYLEFIDGGGVANFKQVKVTSSDWTSKTTSIDKLFRLTLDIELAHENFRQRR